jgi:hypothetical protein
MPGIAVQITRFVDASQPGFVECAFVDAHQRTWSFIEKIPIVTSEDLWIDSSYPQPGIIECKVLSRCEDAAGAIITVDTTLPDGVESVDGMSRFEIRPEQLVVD